MDRRFFPEEEQRLRETNSEPAKATQPVVTELGSNLGPQRPHLLTLTYVASPHLLWRRSLASHSFDTTPTWDLPQQESSPAHPSHPAHCLSILDLVLQAPQETGLPEGTDSAAIPSWQLRQSEHVTGCLVYPSPPVTADPSILRVCNCQTNLHCGFSYTKFCILRKVHKC